MPLEAQRHKYYKAQLNESLQSATALIRNYFTTLCSQTPYLNSQADRIWELSQRHRLVAGINEDASTTLLSACHEAYQSIYHFIKDLHETLSEITVHIQDFDRESQALAQELGYLDEQQQCALLKWNSWLAEVFRVLQTHAKFLELDSRCMLPKLIQSSTIKQFKRDLNLDVHYKANICMGLAEAERRPDLLP